MTSSKMAAAACAVLGPIESPILLIAKMVKH